jgi:hypothetical protein
MQQGILRADPTGIGFDVGFRMPADRARWLRVGAAASAGPPTAGSRGDPLGVIFIATAHSPDDSRPSGGDWRVDTAYLRVPDIALVSKRRNVGHSMWLRRRTRGCVPQAITHGAQLADLPSTSRALSASNRRSSAAIRHPSMRAISSSERPADVPVRRARAAPARRLELTAQSALPTDLISPFSS